MLKPKKILFFTTISLILSFFIQINASAAVVYLNVKACKQKYTNWCWIATTQCIAKYLVNSQLTQDDICRETLGSVKNAPGSYLDDLRSLKVCGLTGINYDGQTLPSELREMIVGWYSPTKAIIQWKNGGPIQHCVVIYGWTDPITSNDEVSIAYMDPAQDRATWNTCVYGYFQDNDEFTWSETIGYIKKS